MMNNLLAAIPGIALLTGAILLLPLFKPHNLLVRRGLILVVLALSIRYLWWRVTETLPPLAQPADFAFGLLFLLLELMLAFSTYICLITFWRHRDNTPMAEQNERKSHHSVDMPAVDVFIPTYNESWDVLERSILGAKALDYPNFKVWVLDDTRRDWLREKCEAMGVRYLRRADNKGAKAGNLNNALGVSKAETNAPSSWYWMPISSRSANSCAALSASLTTRRWRWYRHRNSSSTQICCSTISCCRNPGSTNSASSSTHYSPRRMPGTCRIAAALPSLPAAPPSKISVAIRPKPSPKTSCSASS